MILFLTTCYLLNRLCRSPPGSKLRFEVYVCTAANRDYAMEAWRVLDHLGVMIPQHECEFKPLGRRRFL